MLPFLYNSWSWFFQVSYSASDTSESKLCNRHSEQRKKWHSFMKTSFFDLLTQGSIPNGPSILSPRMDVADGSDYDVTCPGSHLSSSSLCQGSEKCRKSGINSGTVICPGWMSHRSLEPWSMVIALNSYSLPHSLSPLLLLAYFPVSRDLTSYWFIYFHWMTQCWGRGDICLSQCSILLRMAEFSKH